MKSVNDVIKDVLYESDKKFWKDIYDKEEDHWVNKEPSNLTKKIIIRYDKFDKIGKVLEIGCAAGIDTFILATIANKVVGIDIVPEAIKIAKENLKEQPKKIRDRVTFKVGDAEHLDFKDGEFNFVYSLSVLHTTNINKSLKEIRRVLDDDDGKAVIYVFIGKGDKELSPKEFIFACEKYFNIVEEPEKIKVKKDKEDDHTAMIVHLEVKNED